MANSERILVVGAGLVGLTTALELLHHGHDVTIVDPVPASGATHHAGGMLAPVAEVVYKQDALYPLMVAASEHYPALIDMLPADRPTGYRTEGTVVVAADRADAQHVRELAAHQAANGMSVHTVTTRQARSMEPALSPQLSGAVHIPGDHQVFPRMFAASIVDVLGDRLIREKVVSLEVGSTTAVSTSAAPSPSVSAKTTSTPATVHTEQRKIECDQVILANGLGAADLLKDLGIELPLRPVYGDILRLKDPMQGGTPLVSHVVRGFVEDRPVYIIPRVDGTIAIGATSREDGRSQPQVAGIHQLLRDAIRIVPGLEDCDFLEATAGARPGTPDDLPYLGRVHPQLIISTGYFRHGILLAALAAQVTCALIDKGIPPLPAHVLEACNPTRFSP